MTLLDKLKPEYKEKLKDHTIKILSNHEYYIDLDVVNANILCYDLTGKSLNLSSLLGLFYEIKEMKEVLIERVNEYDRTLDSTIFPDKEIEKMRELIKEL